MYIYKVGVVGAGTMGAQIAEVVSYAGVPVLLADIQESLARRGVESVRAIYQARVDKGKMMGIAMAAMTLVDKGYIPESADILANTKLLQPGQTETIEFTLGVKFTIRDSKAEAEAWAAADPYAKAGLFASVMIQEWKRVIG